LSGLIRRDDRGHHARGHVRQSPRQSTRTRRGYLWSAKVGRDATNRRLVDKLIERAFDGSAQLLVAHLFETQRLSDADRKQVLALLKRGAARSSGKDLPAPSDPAQPNS
jgi:hypothetical protein